jgi:hypothetical protein
MPDTYNRSLGPEILPIIAEHADVETINILASAHPLKVSYDVSFNSIAANRSLLEKRHDYDEKLADAFEELIAIASAEADETKSVDSILETGFFLSAKSSFHSELAGAISTLDLVDVTPTDSDNDEKEEWEDSREHIHSPTSPTSREHFRSPTSPTSKAHFHSPTSPTSRAHFHSPTSPTFREHFRSPTSPTSRAHFHSPTSPTSPTSREHFRSPTSPAREHFHTTPPSSPLRRQVS